MRGIEVFLALKGMEPSLNPQPLSRSETETGSAQLKTWVGDLISMVPPTIKLTA